MSAAPFVLPADHSERSLALEPSRSFIVQAPAGSGKTELLIQRYLTLLAHVEAPEQVLAITFTRKAAGEMRARVLDALRRAAEETEPRERNSQLTWRLARAALESDARLAWNVRSAPARLRIETIDALCLQIARRMPWLARFGAMPGIVEDARELYTEAARDTLQLLGNRDYGPAIEQLALHVDNDFDRACRLLETMLEKRDQWLRHVGSGAHDPNLRATLEATLTAVVTNGLQQLHAAFPAQCEQPLVEVARFAARNLARENPDHAMARCSNLTALPDDLESWVALADLLLTGSGDWRKQTDRRFGFPPGDKQKKQEFSFLVGRLARCEGLLERFIALRRLPAPRYTDRQWDFLKTLFTVLPAAVAQLKIAFQRRGVVDFVELGQAAQRALGPPDAPTDLALAFGHRIEHILVDEVQDTSVTQLELLEALIAGWDAGERSTLFLVGDPMQSIYRFREAEVGLFLSMRLAGLRHIAPEPLTLRVNFRSRSGLVDWVNERLAQIFPTHEDIATGAVAYSSSAPFRAAGETPAVRVHPFLEDDPESEARLTADLVEEARRDFPEGSAAILVRARTHLPAIVRELQRRGLRFRAVEIDLLTERPVVRDLLAITRAALHPGDRIAWLALLRAPWCGLTLAELHEIATADLYAPIFDLLPASGNPRVERVKRVMTTAISECRRVPLRECVERAWNDLGGPSCLTADNEFADAHRLLSLLEEVQHGGEIEDLDLLETRLFGEPDPSASDQLQIMTIHRAKGLEFDTVIVPGLGYSAGQEEDRLLHWAEVQTLEGRELLFAPVESKQDEKDPTCRYLRRLDREKNEQEIARLLYVACTRARERLHLIGHATVREDEAGLRALAPPRAGSLLERLWPIVEPEFAQALESFEPGGVAEQTKVERAIRRLPVDWQPPPLPANIEWRPLAMEETAALEAVTFEWVGDTLRHVGTVVHALLERVAREGLEGWDERRIAQRGPIIRTALASLGVPSADLAQAVDRVARAIRGILDDPRGVWILTRRHIEACEFSAAVSDNGVVCSLTVDRTFVDEDNVRWIIDYKTSDHLGGDREGFLNNEVERYRAQLEGYARLFEKLESRPIRCGLYFPLLGGWREWAPS